MIDPFEQLDVDENASDETIKNAYLRKVREYPPEHATEHFKKVRDAYEKIKSEKDRFSYTLFFVPEPALEYQSLQASSDDSDRKYDAAKFREFFADALKTFPFHESEQETE